MLLRHPAVDPALSARAELEQLKLRALAALAARRDLDTCGSAARYLAHKVVKLGRRVRVDPYGERGTP